MSQIKHDNDAAKKMIYSFTIIKQHPLATLVFIDANNIPHISHIPFHLSADERYLIGHVSNRHVLAKKLKGQGCDREGVDLSLVFHGESRYMSPNDVGPSARKPQTVPTWKYSNTHVVGVAVEIVDRADKYQQMVLTSAYFELNQTTPWTMDKVPRTAVSHMLNAITVFKVSIIELNSILKV
ncbi:FMN-binding negative transcriptional regulator [Moritella sp. 36]|uniref:FMN-binding negative transcriptional regulator n=1 Tax=Moritella sp. 36 TaxID=2746233 RepID=UPI001BA54AC7|nr:FMN-binding negative transcriptional regulator [Moritella sp. 36]QUM88768.1 FMN-binding negative transcriptional regulator [Moritella sp. 36]